MNGTFQSQDSGYDGRLRNGYRNERNGSQTSPNYGMERRSPSAQEPSGKAMLNGYQAEIMNGFEGDMPRYNPMNPTRPQSSTLLNLNDSIQVHLLVETALEDSMEFELLSQEEVDSLKRQCQMLSQRIDQTRQNLIIQSKYRDAARSMSKLYLPSEKKKSLDGANVKIRNLLGHNRNSSSEHAQEAKSERMASEKKCEDLAAELWFLEKRLMEPQTRLLKHTAGILQMTHKGPKTRTKGISGPVQSGIPGSPESMYTYSNERKSSDLFPNEELFFDERSLYRSFDVLDGFGEFGFGGEGGGLLPPSQEQLQIISDTEQKLEHLNSRLREVIIQANPQQESRYGPPPSNSRNAENPTKPGENLQDALNYLEQGISTIDREHSELLQKRDMSEVATEETVEEMNTELHNLLKNYDDKLPPPPRPNGKGLSSQLSYFQDSISALEAELSSSKDLSTKNNGSQDQTEAVMMGLWEIIRSGEEEARQRKLERNQARALNNLPPDEDESGVEDSDPSQQFTLQSFSGKVQFLYSQATKLKEQKKVLQRQIKQQRELNNKSDAAKDADITQKAEELTRMQDLLGRTERDADSVREQLGLVMDQLDHAKQSEQLSNQARSNDESSAVQAAQADLDTANQLIADLEEQLHEVRDDQKITNAETQTRVADAEGKITSLTQELAAAATAQAAFEASVRDKEKEIEAKEKEMDDMNMRLAELVTEVTIARAELDGAYGSRSQRAAEVAANPAIQKEIDGLTKKNLSLTQEISELKAKGTANPETEEKMKTLRKELEETIEEYEQMTKASIEWEKDREQLEGTIDKLRDQREQLEAQLSDEKVRWLGMKSSGADGTMPGPGSTSTTVLKNEFKKMMRDTRAESAKALRAEQAERRRVEDELRSLKRAQGPGKSSLSQSIG